MRTRTIEFRVDNAADTAAYKLITTWEELANLLHMRVNHLSYARKYRPDLQRRISLGKRVVYASKSPLSYIQRRLGAVFNAVMDELPDNEVAIAYRPGVRVAEVLAECAGSAVMIKTDVTKYYDNISFAHITDALTDIGFAPRGARLIAGYCCVYNGKFTSLQQGSACSPALANIVGNKYLDAPILRWLEVNCTVPYKYYRYSDNLVLFCKEEPGSEFVDAYKAAVKDIAHKGRFNTHSWSTIRNNHPKRHQEFLGVVLNATANIYRGRRDWLKAVLINSVLKNREEQAAAFFEKTGGLSKQIAPEAKVLKMLMALQGYCAYATMVNKKFGAQVTKIHALLKYMVTEDLHPVTTPAFVDCVRQYKLEESTEVYVARCKAAMSS